MVGFGHRTKRRLVPAERAAVIAVHDSAGDSSHRRGLIEHARGLEIPPPDMDVRCAARTGRWGDADRVLDDLAALAADPRRKADVGHLACPALIVAGGGAPPSAQRAAEILAGALPCGNLRLIAGADHMAARRIRASSSQ